MAIRPERVTRFSRLVVALLVAVVLAAACGDDAAPDVDLGADDPTSTTDGGVPDTDGTGGPGSGAPEPTTGPPPSAGGDAPGTTAGGGQPPPPTTATTRTAPPPVSGVGGYAAFYLRPAESARVVLDIHSQSGAEPTADTVAHVRGVLAEVTGKTVELNGGTISGAGRSWTADQIRSLADSTGLAQSRDRAVLKLFFLRGDFGPSDSVLGVAVRSDVAAVFSDKVDAAAGVLASPARIERAVATHEVGHLLGLVDLVLSTGREDPEHPGHSTNRESVMYWAVESDLVGTVLDGGPPTTFDAADRADLAAIRNG